MRKADGLFIPKIKNKANHERQWSDLEARNILVSVRDNRAAKIYWKAMLNE